MRNNLTQGAIASQLIKLTLPMVGGIAAIVAFNLADTYFVGQLGTDRLAAMSFTFPVVLTLGNLALGLGIWASSIIARAIGEGDRSKVQRLTTNSLTLGVVAVVVLASVGLLTIEPLFLALGADDTVMPYIKEYMQIWYFGMMFLVVPMVGNSAIRAAGDTSTPSLIMTFSAGLNILLDPLLIFGLWGFPELGLSGAALATVISRAMTLIASLLILKFKENMLTARLPGLRATLCCWRDILTVGLPAAGSSMITPISIGVITSFLATYGSATVAGFGVASRVESFSLIVLMALSASIAPFVGQNWGAKKYQRVTTALSQSYLFCLVWGLLAAILLSVLGASIAGLFNQNPEVIAIARTYLLGVPITYGAAGIILVTNSTFNALGRPLPPVIITVSRMLVLYVPLAYVGSRLFGAWGVFVAAAIANGVMGLVAYLWSRRICPQRFS